MSHDHAYLSAESDESDMMVFGTYDETNCVTNYPTASPSHSQEVAALAPLLQESMTTKQDIDPEYPHSPSSAVDSGCGTHSSATNSEIDLSEKHGEVDDLDDLWNDSFSELFPTLV